MGTRHGASALSTQDAGAWVRAHEALSRLARERAALDAEEGRWLLCAWRSAAHVHLGYGSFAQYIERLFGYKPRTTQEKLRVAEALETLPLVEQALELGAVTWCAARELTRVAVPETESAWLEVARGKTVRELETLVASHAPGDAPDAPAVEQPRSRVLRFEVAADTFATFREAMHRLQRMAGGSLDDDTVLLAMARHVLGGPRDEGRSSYQVALSICSACGGGAQRAGSELVPIDRAIVAMATCDAQHLAELLPRVSELRAANEKPAPTRPLAHSAEDPMPLPCRAVTRTPEPASAQTTPTWARATSARSRASHRPCAAPCSLAIDTVAEFRAALTRRSSMYTMSSLAPRGAATRHRTF